MKFYETIDKIDKKNTALLKQIMPTLLKYAFYGFFFYWIYTNKGFEQALIAILFLLFVRLSAILDILKTRVL